MTKTLDLGCGARPKNPFAADELFGVDVRDGLGDHVRQADLVIEPIPYADASFDYLSAYDFIEHVPRVIYAPARRNAFVEFMNEAYRVLKPGGYFVSSTPAYPYALAFRDPTHVNIITDETFPFYFDDEHRWSAMYGFNGAFHVVRHEWRGPYLYAVLRKVPVKPDPAVAVDANARISVVLPVRDAVTQLSRTLDSLLEQTHADLEVLCVDDCSTDASLALLLSYAERDKRVRVLQTPRAESGAASLLELAAAAMTGGYVAWASPGDSFSADALSNMLARARATGADAVLPDVVFAEGTAALVGLNGDRSVELTGRDALGFSLQGRPACHALFRAGLVRFFGFTDVGENSLEHSARVFLLSADKVVFSEGNRFVRAQDEAATARPSSGFDAPYAQLRLFQLLNAESFPAETLQREALKAVTQRNDLLQWLNEHAAGLAPAARDQAHAWLERCTASMRKDPMFTQVA